MNIKTLIVRAKWKPIDIKNKIVFWMRHIKYGKDLCTYGTIFVRGHGKIQIGNHVTITSCRETNPIGGDTKTLFFLIKKNGQIVIGNRVGMSNVSIVASQLVEIEDDVLIGGGCKIYDYDFHSVRFEERIKENDLGAISKPVKIKKGAFIGAHSIILKGVTIGQYSVIGAGSVVTKNVPDNEIWAGNPARFIRKIEP